VRSVLNFGVQNPCTAIGLSAPEFEEWPKSAPFFFSATLLLVLNPSFFGVCKWNFPSRMKSIVFIFSCNNSTVVKNKLLPHTAAGPWRALNVMAQPSAGLMVSDLGL
jgi:hypothetical protein